MTAPARDQAASRLTAVPSRARFAPIDRPAWSDHLPGVVVAEVERRRTDLLARMQGRLLDLADPGAIELALDAAAVGTEVGSEAPAPDERYDAIVSTCRLVDVADLPAVLAGLRRLLADGGELHLVEPINQPGFASLMVSSGWAVAPALSGMHLGRDVVRAARASDLAVVDLDRFEIATPVFPLRRWAQLRAIIIDGHGHHRRGDKA